MLEPPTYDELPLLAQIGLRASWGHLPAGLGTLALQTPAAVLSAAHGVRTGEVVSLSLGTAAFDPPLFGRPPLDNRVHESGRNTYEDEIGSFNPQASSQWDGLPHIRAREFGFYSGITDLEQARDELGIQHWGRRGIVGRGVLVDVPRWSAQADVGWDPLTGEVLEPEQLTEVLQAQGVELLAGDVLLIRTGWLAARRALATPPAGERFSGIASHDAMVRLLWNARISALGSDNPAVESAPGDPANGSLHRKLIPGLGFALAELLDLEVLADRCAARGDHSFLFVAAPTPIDRAVSSPANALAIL